MNNQHGRLPIIAILLTLCFSGIMMFVLFGILSLPERTGGIARIVFSCINCLMLIALASGGNILSRVTSVATVIQLWSVTMFYTVAQFGSVFIGINIWYGNLYVLYQLIILFIYLCVALPILSISYKKNN